MLYRMGSIIARKRKDGTSGYLAQIVIKRKGQIVHREAQTFDRRQAAKAWIALRESQLTESGGLERREDPLLSAVIDRCVAESNHIGKTKAQVLNSIRENYDISRLRCSQIDTAAVVQCALTIDVSPQTRQNYLSHLGAVFTVAQPAWRYPLSQTAVKEAMTVLKRLGRISKSNQRTRRPTLDELDRLMTHFQKIRLRRPKSAPMPKIIGFAIFSTRRQDEIARAMWNDYEKEAGRMMVRDMKDPGDKIGNDVLCEIPSEAIAIIDSMPKAGELIFPYSADAISAAFTRACKILGIEDLHFHDLRHDGISRLFEMGKTIPQAAVVSGHRSWSSLKRYAHLRQTGDKYADWKWLKSLNT
jgi:integrase